MEVQPVQVGLAAAALEVLQALELMEPQTQAEEVEEHHKILQHNQTRAHLAALELSLLDTLVVSVVQAAQ